jgi:hypothetical protein
MTKSKTKANQKIRSTKIPAKSARSTKTVDRKSKKIPPLAENATMEEEAEYYDKYSMIDLLDAGYLKEVDEPLIREELKEAVANYRKRQQVNISLSAEQFSLLEKLATRRHLSPATLVRCWLLERLDNEARL